MKKFYTFRETMGEQIAPGMVAVFRAEEVSDALTQLNDGWIAATKERDAMRGMLIKLRDQGTFHNSAIELDPRHDGEQLLAEIEALVGAR